ncbi:Bromodomain-containing protein [Rhizopus microsporus ATCC 52813]|uniref:Bromodomain-domain-containing protein n=1 Tax=Rhizopus microsporus ATCC 52813 TaxID=1340429 RepID=A0A2G4SZ13_RHIZD|nr:Bromodomain-containing protein [Rhizopus microsporus ATCC 52813]PHZ14019.1 Bromodomain-domain-containing protein [Rhizopus microsporus ATCC 52813]
MERPKRQSTVDKDYREHKRSKKGETASSPIKEESLSPFEQLYRDVVNYRDPEDEDYDITAIFMKLPSKKEYPDYYQIIKQPIALETIKNKVEKNMYQNISQMKADIELMVSNAKKYNMKGSQIYEDAIKIQRYVKGWQGVKEKAVLKLPGEAFNSAPKIKAIKLKAIDKPKKSSINTKALMTAIIKREVKKALELLDTDPQIDPNELVPAEMFNDKFTWGPLHAACYYGDIKLVEALIAKGAEVEKQDTWHSATPLGWAAFGDKHNVVRLLLQKYNANKNAKNVHGQVPFELVSNQDDPRWIGLFKVRFRNTKEKECTR